MTDQHPPTETPADPTADAAALDPAATTTATTAPPLEPAPTPNDPAGAKADPAPTANPDVAAAAATATPSTGRRRVLRLVAGIYWLIARLFAIALFVGGVALGYSAFLATQPAPTFVVDPAVEGVAPPAAVEEFISALTSNDPDALRSVIPAEPYQLLIAEMARWGFTSVTSVERLSTMADGDRTATEIVMSGPTDSGVPVTVNLVIHVDAGQIASFR